MFVSTVDSSYTAANHISFIILLQHIFPIVPVQLPMNMFIYYVLLLFVVPAITAIESNKNNAVANPKESYTMSTGLQLAFSHSPALDRLKIWTHELDHPQDFPKLNYQVAVQRELEVVQQIDAGLWPQEVYTEYQKLVSTTGNVDSAGLLIRYGVASTIENTVSLTSEMGQFHHSVMYCKGEEFLQLFDAGKVS